MLILDLTTLSPELTSMKDIELDLWQIIFK